MSKSTTATSRRKPGKPHRDFPLFPQGHASPGFAYGEAGQAKAEIPEPDRSGGAKGAAFEAHERTRGPPLALAASMRSAITAFVFAFDRVRTVLLALSVIILLKAALVLTALTLAG